MNGILETGRLVKEADKCGTLAGLAAQLANIPSLVLSLAMNSTNLLAALKNALGDAYNAS
jgi:hypothetical protein